jgi:sugar fermentation stimulation protein A
MERISADPGEDRTLLIEVVPDARGVFRRRPNRFLGIVDILEPDRETDVRVHTHDPGRLRELLYPGNEVLLRRVTKPGRTTVWDLLAAKWGEDWILAHTGYHRTIAERILGDPVLSPLGDAEDIIAEVKRNGSRLDFLLKRRDGSDSWVEVKGCTLVEERVALFPDAPTERGRRHLRELKELSENGADARVLVLVFRRDAECFKPNERTDPEFADAFREALEGGVRIHPVVIEYRDGMVRYFGEIPVCKGDRGA